MEAVLMPQRLSERQEMLLVSSRGLLVPCLDGIRVSNIMIPTIIGDEKLKFLDRMYVGSRYIVYCNTR